MSKRELRRAMILCASGMANETKEAQLIYKRSGWFGLISWRTRQLEKMFDFFLS